MKVLANVLGTVELEVLPSTKTLDYKLEWLIDHSHQNLTKKC